MKNSPSVGDLGGIIAKFIRRHHIVIYSMTIVIGVSVAVFFLNNLIALSNSTDDSQPVSTSFDKTTIERIEALNMINSDSNDGFSLPAGRINPFVE